MSILEELWYGNIEPAEHDISPDKKYKEMLQLISRNEDIPGQFMHFIRTIAENIPKLTVIQKSLFGI